MSDFNSAYKKICKIAANFKAGESHYLSAKYNEMDARRDFIDKFFEALGWDVYHNTQKNPYEQEVRVEKNVAVGKTQKRADYSFCISPNYRDTKFYVEAKKPSKNLYNPDYYFQAIRYGWNANTPIVILTDFEEIHIIDCRFKPDIKSALDRQIERFHYSEFLEKEKLSRIYYLLSREAVADNSIEKRAAELPKPRGKAVQKGLSKGGYQSIDESFLEELDEIRITLAKIFKKNNPGLTSEELTESTQRTIDRLVFMRFLEDKLIEGEHFVNEFGKRNSVWKDFINTSKHLDNKYNGVVFKRHPIIDSPAFKEADDIYFGKICEDISHENSPYDFNAIPIHILGSIYERFLGKVIHATNKQVRIEEKPEVRKAGGVYYTPQYIVKYIVDNTVGKILKNEDGGKMDSRFRGNDKGGKTPAEISKLRFADIACGSGSFLITVYDTLLQYIGKWYQEHPEQAKKDGCIFKEGQWVLSLKQKQEILLNNIYGVDIDSQAVEVTQLSLFLKLLEDETTATANDMQVLFKEKILPDLSKNIVCGNSLIGTDIYDGNMFPTEDERKINAMNFEDVFPEIMKNGGFDAIVGNPPYVRQESIKIYKEYFEKNYSEIFTSSGDLYIYFIYKSIKMIKEYGFFSYIVSNKFTTTNYGKKLRNYLAYNTSIVDFIDKFEHKVFPNVGVDPCIIVIKKYFDKQNKINYNNKSKIVQTELKGESWTFAKEETLKIKSKIESKGKIIRDYKDVNIYFGIKSGLSEAFIINRQKRDKFIKEDKNTKVLFKKLLRGRDVKKYKIEWDDLYLIDLRIGVSLDKYPKLKNYFLDFKTNLLKRTDYKDSIMEWYNLRPCTYYNEFEKPKIIYPDISENGGFYWDEESYYFNNTIYMICGSPKYWVAILNSKLISMYYKLIATNLGEKGIRYFAQFVEQIPIVENVENKDKFNLLVDQMLEAKKQLQTAKTDKDKTYYERRCETLDRQIDQLVYELYGLTEEEIRIVEGV